MKNSINYEILPKTSSPVAIKNFVNHNSAKRVHFHEEIEILYLTKGCDRVISNMQEHDVKAGDIVFVNGKELHTGCLCGRDSTYYCIQVKTDFFHNLIENEYVIFENIIRDDIASSLLDKLILEEKKGGFKSAIAVKKTLYEFFEYISENFARFIFSGEEYKKHFKRLDTFNSVIEYIDEHYRESISADSLAARFFISTSYFSHLFKERANMSFVEYLNETRLRHARTLLENEDLSIGEISLNVGFNDINYFSRIFKKKVGITPTEYRRGFKNN